MSIKGQNTKSIRKKSLNNTRNPVVGTKNIVFHHSASSGETVIDITNLNAPSGFVNPSPSELTKARIKDFEENLILMSSAKGTLQRGVGLGYTITTNNTIKLNFEAEEGEIFSGLFLNVTINGTLIADVRTPGATGTLLEGETDFVLGEAIPINDLNNDLPILVFRGINQTLMHRNTLNGASGGNYQMLDNGDGYCSVIRFNDPGDVGDEPISWSARGALGERANLSVLQQNENVLGIVNRMKDDVLEALGFDVTDPTRYDGVPTNADLKAFGEKVQKILNTEITQSNIQTYEHDSASSTFGAVETLNVVLNSPSREEGTGVFTETTDNDEGTKFTILEDCALTIGFRSLHDSDTAARAVFRDGVSLIDPFANHADGNERLFASVTIFAKKDEVYSFGRSAVAANTIDRVFVTAVSHKTSKIQDLI